VSGREKLLKKDKKGIWKEAERKFLNSFGEKSGEGEKKALYRGQK